MTTEAKMEIRLTDEGEVRVRGPLQNPLLCYGLLEAAKDAIRENKATGPRIQPPTDGDLDSFLGRN
ncbi:MAG: hypothetical protein ACOC5J_03420 [Gemmatimonadota bacterium]